MVSPFVECAILAAESGPGKMLLFLLVGFLELLPECLDFATYDLARHGTHLNLADILRAGNRDVSDTRVLCMAALVSKGGSERFALPAISIEDEHREFNVRKFR